MKHQCRYGGETMKKSQIFIPLLVFVILASLETHSVKAEKPLKIECTIQGNIMDETQEINGVMSLTLSGQFRDRTPDYDEEIAGEYTYGPYEYENTWENTYEMDGTLYKEVGYSYYYDYQWENTSMQVKKWYGPQSSYNGEILAIWQDGSTSTFGVRLSPSEIGRSVYEREFYSEYHNIYNYTIYEWDGDKWVYDYEYENRYGNTQSGTMAGSTFNIEFIGKIQGKGSHLRGRLAFSQDEYWQDVSGTSYSDGYTDEWTAKGYVEEYQVTGEFGPYNFYAYKQIYTPSE